MLRQRTSTGLTRHIGAGGSGVPVMMETQITLPELALVAGTRAALGFGLGMLLADRFSSEQRRAIGWTLVAVGAVTTIPLVLEVFGHRTTPANGKGSAELTESAELCECL